VGSYISATRQLIVHPISFLSLLSLVIGVHVVLICFSVSSPSSIDRIRSKWIPELNRHCRGVPIVLVGTKTDLRTDANHIAELDKKGEHVIKYDDGITLAKDIGATKYMECSSNTPGSFLFSLPFHCSTYLIIIS
jgi:GTPase SAR1 family protein